MYIQNKKMIDETQKETGNIFYQIKNSYGLPQNEEPIEFTDKKDADIWGHDNYDAWEDSLSNDENQAISDYTGSYYLPINEYLRNNEGQTGTDPKLDSRIYQIDSALEDARVPEAIIVYRRVTEMQFGEEYGWLRNPDGIINMDNAATLELKYKETIFKQYSYMSTSLVQDIDSSFSSGRYPILFEITVPEGIEAAYIDELSKHPGQTEFLINRGYAFEYGDFYIIYDKGYQVLKIEVSFVLS